MKVLYIEPCTLNFGGYYRSLEICLALSHANIQVDLLVSSDHKFSPTITKKNINKNFNLYILPRIYLNFYITGRVLRGLIATIFGLFGRYDIVQASSPVQLESNIPLLILKLVGKKVIVSWEDIWTDGAVIFSQLVMQYLKFWEKYSPKIFENVQCISQILLNRATKLGAKNVIKLINGTDPSYPCPDHRQSLSRLHLNPKYKHLLIFGNTFDGQRTYHTLKVFQKILALHPHTILITNFDPHKFVSSQPNISKILPSTFKNILNVGYIKEGDLPNYLAASDAILFIMGNNINEKACFPIRMSKFLSSESVVIINENHSETTSVLTKYNCAIIDSNFTRLANKTVKYFHSPSIKRQLKTNVRTAKKELSWDNQIQPLITLYDKILHQ